MSLTTLVQFIGYPGLFAAVFLESGVFFGFFLPGASMLFTAGLLASSGYFNVSILIPLLTIAAILGDNAGYWFGAKIGIRLFLRPDSRFFHHSHVERAKDFYEKYGSRAIFLARFIPVVRTFAPIVAGVVGMKYRIFITYNILGAVVWGAGVTFAGYYLVAQFPSIQQYISLIILGIIVVTTLPIFIDIWRRYREVPESKIN